MAEEKKSPLNHEEQESKHLDEMFFEGPEKLLEIWFVKEGKDDAGDKGLRTIPNDSISKMLDLVHCTILHKTSNDYFDAYVLSESSLFVYPYKIILKTCGTTTLLRAVPTILELARSHCGLTLIGDVFYSRRNFFSDHKQLEPHGSFQDEVKFLDQIFHGSAYILGKRNGDHWYLYLTDGDEYASNEKDLRPLPVVPALKPLPGAKPDFTLEILMTDLSREHMKIFYKGKDFVSARDVTDRSGIGGLVPGAIIDDHMFDPFGYSMNGLLDDGYFTIHVTPQENCSYASFETNIHTDYSLLLPAVLGVFRPNSFTVTLFAGNYSQEDFTKLTSTLFSTPELKQYGLQTKIRYEFQNNYELVYAHYQTSKVVVSSKKRKTFSVSEVSDDSSKKVHS